MPEELLNHSDPLQAEAHFSEIVGSWWGQELVEGDIDEVFYGGLIDRAADLGTRKALALLRAFAALAPATYRRRALTALLIIR
ncbi:hypothetical protein [Actinomadura fibrosa]|uniref:Uncharacterized protein n=1 Tax=Actinomadura fibrosa TaxID=111802 RepID=A0ABW2XE92_9ACTN|nr:hypothetical protein [Actinomadura fibrosa]